MAREKEEAFRYDKMVERALRGVVSQALKEVANDGLVEDHHFYITFFTDYPGVAIPSYLKERYPGEMTIVLQHQFYDLEVEEEGFTVMLSFNNVPERLSIPLSAVTIFADPSVNFALQFQPLADEEDEIHFEAEELEVEKEDTQGAQGEVISLDQFRKDTATDNEEKPKAKPKAKKDKEKPKAKPKAKKDKEKPKAKPKAKKDKEKPKAKPKGKGKNKDKDDS